MQEENEPREQILVAAGPAGNEKWVLDGGSLQTSRQVAKKNPSTHTVRPITSFASAHVQKNGSILRTTEEVGWMIMDVGMDNDGYERAWRRSSESSCFHPSVPNTSTPANRFPGRSNLHQSAPTCRWTLRA